MKFIIAQIVGFVAILFTIVSIQQNRKKKVLIFIIIENILYAVQYFLLGALSGALMSILDAIKSYIFYNFNKKGKEKSIIVLILFLIITTILGIVFYKNIFSLLPIITSMMYSYGTWQSDLKKFRIIALIVPILWIIYNCYVLAYMGIISSIFQFISACIAILRLDILKRQVIEK